MMRPRGLSLIVLLAAAIAGAPMAAVAQTASADLPNSPQPAWTTTPPDRRAPSDREETWKKLPLDFLHDQKQIWLVFPSRMGRGHYWIPVLAVSGVTAGLLYADPHIEPYFSTHQRNWDDFNDTFDAYITTGEIVAIPASLLAAGYVRHDPYQVSTALLCADAYADSAMVDLAMKAVTRRERPVDVPPRTPFEDTFFAGNESPVKGSSFPSGHAAGAFSVATVVARRYANHKWVPWLAYGFATVVGFTRVPSLAHFTSDVFVGGAIGYATTEYATLRPR
jgi:membrane-associated phospholipid phosphatase